MRTSKAVIKSALTAKVDFSADFHALPWAAVDALVSAAKCHGYKKPKNSNGSTARSFFEYLNSN